MCPVKKGGNGNPIICPIDTYINKINKINAMINLCKSFFNAALLLTFSYIFAPYPASLTALIISLILTTVSS